MGTNVVFVPICTTRVNEKIAGREAAFHVKFSLDRRG